MDGLLEEIKGDQEKLPRGNFWLFVKNMSTKLVWRMVAEGGKSCDCSQKEQCGQRPRGGREPALVRQKQVSYMLRFGCATENKGHIT